MKKHKNMKTTLFTIVLFLGSIVFCHAQDNYKQGYIITNEMDTIYGWIDYRTDAMNALGCKFKTDKQIKEQTYQPGSIFGYRLINEGKFYISKNITINNVSQMVFVEFLVQGIMNLYFFVDSRDFSSTPEYYIFEDETGNMTVVTKKPDQYVINENGITHRKVDNAYKGVIRYLFQNSDAAMQNIEQLQFTQQSIIDITKDYHRQICTTGEDCIVFTGTPDKNYYLFKFSVYAGYQIFLNSSLLNTQSLLAGGRLNVITPRFSEYISFQLDLSISQLSGKYSEIDNENNRQYEYSQILVPLKFGFKYTFGKYKLCPSVELGGMYYFYHIKSNLEEMFKSSGFGGEFGYFAGCGLDYVLKNRHAIFFGASLNKGANLDVVSSINVNLVQFKLGYTW